MLRTLIRLAFLLVLLAAGIGVSDAAKVRIKDVARTELERGNQLVGYGLVVGLNATGDDSTRLETAQAIKNYLALMTRNNRGPDLNMAKVEPKNSALVVVTAELPPYVRAGSRLDITVSSQFDAKSLVGGTLIATPLFGVDGQIYAMAQGPVSVGGFSQGGGAGGGGGQQKNHPTVGLVTDGAIIERNANYLREKDRERLNSGKVNLILKNPDFIQARNIQRAINESFNLSKVASALDPGTVEVDLTALMARYEYDTPMEAISEIEELQLNTDMPARVIVSERTGVVIAGGEAKLSAVDIVQGDLRIMVKPAQPGRYIQEGGRAGVDETGGYVEPESLGYQYVEGQPPEATVSEGDKTLVQLEEGDTVGNLIRAISGGEVETSPRDIISILQALDRMGALHARMIFVED